MSSVITVKIKYDDNSKSYQESFNCVDTHPSIETIRDCEQTIRYKWVEMGETVRHTQMHTKVR